MGQNGVKRCIKCGQELALTARFCGNCGTVCIDETKKMRYCGECGTELSPNATFCGNCGKKTSAAVQQEIEKAVPNGTRKAVQNVLEGLRVSAADIPGEFSYGNSLGETGKGAVQQLLQTPIAAVFNSLAGFVKGFVNTFTNPRSLVFTIVLALLWILLWILERKEIDYVGLNVLSYISFAGGGANRGIIGILAGAVGKCTVAVGLYSLINGKIRNVPGGLKSVFGKGSYGCSSDPGMMLFGGGLACEFYCLFTWKAAAALSMVGITGALLSLEILGGRDGYIYSIINAFTSKIEKNTRLQRNGHVKGILTGIFLGFTFVTCLSIILGREYADTLGWTQLILGAVLILAGVVLSVCFKKKTMVCGLLITSLLLGSIYSIRTKAEDVYKRYQTIAEFASDENYYVQNYGGDNIYFCWYEDENGKRYFTANWDWDNEDSDQYRIMEYEDTTEVQGIVNESFKTAATQKFRVSLEPISAYENAIPYDYESKEYDIFERYHIVDKEGSFSKEAVESSNHNISSASKHGIGYATGKLDYGFLYEPDPNLYYLDDSFKKYFCRIDWDVIYNFSEYGIYSIPYGDSYDTYTDRLFLEQKEYSIDNEPSSSKAGFSHNFEERQIGTARVMMDTLVLEDFSEEKTYGDDWEYYDNVINDVKRYEAETNYYFSIPIPDLPNRIAFGYLTVSQSYETDLPKDQTLWNKEAEPLLQEYERLDQLVHSAVVNDVVNPVFHFDFDPIEYNEEFFGQWEDIVVDSNAEEDPGEDDGTEVDADIVEGHRRRRDDDDEENNGAAGPGVLIPAAILTAGGIGAADDKKRRARSSYKMYINKDFGNTLYRGGISRYVYARMVEVTVDGREIDRSDLTAGIQIYSADGITTVEAGGMTSNGYQSAKVSVYKNGMEDSECVIAFRFIGQAGSLTNNVHFKIENCEIRFYQDNLTLPAVIMDKPKYLPFTVSGMGEDYDVTVLLDNNRDYEVGLTRSTDEELKDVYFAGFVEINKQSASAGVFTETFLTVKAVNKEQTIEERIKVIRIHLGLYISANAINCYHVIKEGSEGKGYKDLRKEDYVSARTETKAYLLVADEENYEVRQHPAFPQMKIEPMDGEENEKVKEALDTLKIELGLLAREEEFAICAFECKGGFLDPPTRYKVKLTLSQEYSTGEGEGRKTTTYYCVKEVLLRSQPLRNFNDLKMISAYEKQDEEIREHLMYIHDLIGDNWMNNLFSVYNMIDRMDSGFDSNYGWDPYQVWKVMDVFDRFQRGETLGANGQPYEYGIADDLEALAAVSRSWDGWQGIVLRMSLAYMTGGASEYALTLLDMNRGAMDYHKETGGKGTLLGYFKAGAIPLAFSVGIGYAPAIGRTLGKGVKTIMPKTSAALAARAQGFCKIATETLRETKKLVVSAIPDGAKTASGKIMNVLNEVVEQVNKYDPKITLGRVDKAAKIVSGGTSQARAEGDALIREAQQSARTLDEKLVETAGKTVNTEGKLIYEEVVNAQKALASNPGNKELLQKYNQSLARFKASHAAIEYGNSIRPGQELAIRGTLNADLEKNISGRVVDRVKTKLSKEYGVPKESILIERATANKGGAFKFGRDMDLNAKTIGQNNRPKYVSQARMDDVLEQSTREVIVEECGEEFAEQFAGKGKFAEKMDYVGCTPQHADYFRGGLDTVKAVTDQNSMRNVLGSETARSVGDTLQYKGLHPYQQGLELERAVLAGKNDAQKLALLNELEAAVKGDSKALANLSPDAQKMMDAYKLMEEGLYQPAKYGDKLIEKEWVLLKEGSNETLTANDYLFNRVTERASGRALANEQIREIAVKGERISLIDARKVMQMKGTTIESMIKKTGDNFVRMDRNAMQLRDQRISNGLSYINIVGQHAGSQNSEG